MHTLAALHPVDVVLFTDGDRSFEAAQGVRLLEAIAGGADLGHWIPGAGADGTGRPVSSADRGQPGWLAA